MKPQIGDKIRTWFSDRPDGLSTVLAVEKYYGKYTESFAWVVTVTAPTTKAGKLDMALEKDWKKD